MKRKITKSNTQKQKKQKKMHRENKYIDNPPDFKKLAELYPSFKKLYKKIYFF